MRSSEIITERQERQREEQMEGKGAHLINGACAAGLTTADNEVSLEDKARHCLL